MAERSSTAFFWALFSAGGVAAAFLLPVHVFLFGLAFPLDHYQAADYALIVEKVSEEHGLIRRTGFDLPIGSQVRIIPVHACPVANLAREYVVLDDDQLVTWPVEAAKGSR